MKIKTGTIYGISISLIIINLATMMQRADEKLIPSTAKELKEAFHANLADIGFLSFIRNIVQGLASPLAGLFAISYDRPTVFAFGSFFWVSSTVATGVSRYFIQVILGVAFNGVGHAIVYPVLQSIIADSFKDSSRGFGFGLWNLIGTIGGIGGTVVPTIMAGHNLFGISGWRCAFILCATMSAMNGIFVFFFVTDPKEKKTSSVIVHNDDHHERDENNDATGMESSSSLAWKDSWVAIKDVAKLRTFQIIVFQGIIGSVPWNAMVFWTMWFELIGFDHNQAAIMNGIFTAGQAIGSLVGGIIADKISHMFPNSGRLMCAQFSVFMGAILSLILLRLIPQSINSYYIFLAILFLMGLTITWCGPAINSPILAEIVPPNHRTMVYAFDRSLEVTFASFGAPLVGIMSEKLFGFDSKKMDQIKDSGREAEALSKGIMWMMAVPFGLCCLCYTPLHFLSGKDRKIDRATTSSREVEMI
ncbi:putative sphingolipid transporter spinster-like protein [Cardamine amara subsp. amara]|uniref:Sphingolipid transporter spinster-like protein n=1 Tax=Cardamine amara subsp. amara TaxID=228776 RepID=A0ABD1BAM7_CARAN